MPARGRLPIWIGRPRPEPATAIVSWPAVIDRAPDGARIGVAVGSGVWVAAGVAVAATATAAVAGAAGCPTFESPGLDAGPAADRGVAVAGGCGGAAGVLSTVTARACT